MNSRKTPEHFKRLQAEARAARGIGSSPPSESGQVSPDTRTPLKSDWWSRAVKAVVQRDMGRCHACAAVGCLNPWQAESADHDPVPRSECEARGISLYAMSNLKAIHHKPCPGCGVRCNIVKGNGSMEAFRIKWEKKSGLKAKPIVQPVAPEDEGRDVW
jgi:hypothetical protein